MHCAFAKLNFSSMRSTGHAYTLRHLPNPGGFICRILGTFQRHDAHSIHASWRASLMSVSYKFRISETLEPVQNVIWSRKIFTNKMKEMTRWLNNFFYWKYIRRDFKGVRKNSFMHTMSWLHVFEVMSCFVVTFLLDVNEWQQCFVTPWRDTNEVIYLAHLRAELSKISFCLRHDETASFRCSDVYLLFRMSKFSER